MTNFGWWCFLVVTHKTIATVKLVSLVSRKDFLDGLMFEIENEMP